VEAGNARLRRELASAKLDLETGVFHEGVAVRYSWIERNRDDYAVSQMRRQLEGSRSGYLQWRRSAPSTRAPADAALDARVAAFHAQIRQRNGRPLIVRALHRQGIAVGHERVRQSLFRQTPRPVYRKPSQVRNASGEIGIKCHARFAYGTALRLLHSGRG
jgi:hypothetical protein